MNQGPDKKALAVLGAACLLLLAYVAMGVMQGEARASDHGTPAMKCADEYMPPAITAPDKAAAVTARLVDEARERAQEAVQAEEYAESGYDYQESDYAAYSGSYEVPYSEMYNTDGPTRNMPGWHYGYVETYYDASGHFMAGDWSVDSEGFYHDSEGRYVIGVDINSGLNYGDVVDTGRGEAVVYDYGAGVSNVHDFAVAGAPNR